MNFLMIIKIGLYAFIVLKLLKLMGHITLSINIFAKLNKNEVRYKKPLAEKLREHLSDILLTIFWIGVAIAILTYGFN